MLIETSQLNFYTFDEIDFSFTFVGADSERCKLLTLYSEFQEASFIKTHRDTILKKLPTINPKPQITYDDVLSHDTKFFEFGKMGNSIWSRLFKVDIKEYENIIPASFCGKKGIKVVNIPPNSTANVVMLLKN